MTQPKSLLTLIDRHLESGEVSLPVFDNTAMCVYREVRENRIDAEDLAALIEGDPILASEVLRMANSSFFSGLVEIRSLRDATVRLGGKQIASIVLSINQKRMYSASKGPFRARLMQLWNHTNTVSYGSRWLASHAGFRRLADEAFVAGLLHDVGKLSLLCIIEELSARDRLPLTDELVNEALMQLHTSHGAKLLELWNLPEIFSQIVSQLESEDFDESNLVLAMVRLVDKACALEGISDFPDPTIVLETLRESEVLGLSEIDLAELRITLEDAKDERKAA